MAVARRARKDEKARHRERAAATAGSARSAACARATPSVAAARASASPTRARAAGGPARAARRSARAGTTVRPTTITPGILGSARAPGAAATASLSSGRAAGSAAATRFGSTLTVTGRLLSSTGETEDARNDAKNEDTSTSHRPRSLPRNAFGVTRSAKPPARAQRPGRIMYTPPP
jgi:hypothetical protein